MSRLKIAEITEKTTARRSATAGREPYAICFTTLEELYVHALSFDEDLVTVHASTTKPVAECPLCGQHSRRVPGLHTRTLTDLPWGGTPVRLRVRIREFFRGEPTCKPQVLA